MTIRYVSTRGEAPAVSFADAMLDGLAPDGGLYVPSELPVITGDQFRAWAHLAYAELATEILTRFAPDMDPAVMEAACHEAYSATVFGSAEVVPMTQLADGAWLLHLSNGPTLAFKDMAMQVLARLLDSELSRRGETMTVLGATSGDTGAAAEHAMVGRQNISVVMLSPWQRVSPFQAAQMFSLDEPNIVNLAIEGVFDEAQDLVKEVNADADFKAKHSIGAVNSINWARVAAQIVYYVWAYLRLAPNLDSAVEFAVPTGNFGNIYAGIVARRLGLPLEFVLASNENDVLVEFLSSGEYRVRGKDDVQATSSPSMDIARASNFERFVFDLCRRDAAMLRAHWQALRETGRMDLVGLAEFRQLGEWLRGGSGSHERRLGAIRRVAVEDGIVVDPHTADGLSVAEQDRIDRLTRAPDIAKSLTGLPGQRTGVPLVCLETALPTKFEATIQEALGEVPARPPAFEKIEERPPHVTVIEPEAETVKAHIRAITDQAS